MGQMQRNKGAKGEREAIKLLQPIVDRVCAEQGKAPFVLKRNYSQRFAAKQYDVEGLPWLALEVKRVEQMGMMGTWWRQCLAATRERQTPVLMYRPNNQPWRVRMRVPIRVGPRLVRMAVTVDIGDFLVWFEQRLLFEMGK